MQGKKLPKHSGAVRLLIDTAPASKGTWMCLIQIKAVVGVLWRTRLFGDRATATPQDICCEKIRGCSYREAVRPTTLRQGRLPKPDLHSGQNH
jgi:hypothetical protein